MAASTGSGKTLAYALPTVQYLKSEEEVGYQRQPLRPRALVLVPTRELAQQVLQSFKQLGHHSKISCSAVVGGEDYASQKSAVSLCLVYFTLFCFIFYFDSISHYFAFSCVVQILFSHLFNSLSVTILMIVETNNGCSCCISWSIDAT